MPKDDGSSKPPKPAVTKRGPAYGSIRGQKQPERQVKWSDVPANVIASCIDSVTLLGNAISFGRTSDGGTYSITILAGGERHKFYPGPEEVEGTLVDIMEAAHAFLTELRD